MTDESIRITISIKKSLVDKIRSRQAELIQKTKMNFSFSKAVSYFLEKGLNKK